MKRFKRWREKKKLKKDIKEYHDGRRDQIQISDYEKQEIASLYELKIQEKSAELDKKDDKIKELNDALLYCEKKLEKQSERMISIDGALLVVEKSNEIKHTLDANRYKSVLAVVGMARSRIRRELEKLPKLQKEIGEKVNKVV